mmetsp:Transcript_83173/g.178318  ORF Transcript_83173/g.178318 Transcript_83173/m.178318 type:complete len:237 (+) Transcript_83173:505-1215(+)
MSWVTHVAVEHDVVRLDVLMDEIVLMKVANGDEDLAQDPFAFALKERILLLHPLQKELRQGPAIAPRHDNIKRTVVLQDLIDLDHMRALGHGHELRHHPPPLPIAAPMIHLLAPDLDDYLAPIGPASGQKHLAAVVPESLVVGADVVEVLHELARLQPAESPAKPRRCGRWRRCNGRCRYGSTMSAKAAGAAKVPGRVRPREAPTKNHRRARRRAGLRPGGRGSSCTTVERAHGAA